MDRQKLVSALADYDTKQAKKPHHNIHALALYLQALNNAFMLVEKKKYTPRRALVASFTGRLLDACLRAIGEVKATNEELRSAGH